MTLHTVFEHRSWPSRLALRRLLERASAVVAHTDRTVARLDPAVRDRVRVIPHGPYGQAGADPARGEGVRSRPGLPERARLVLFFGQIRPYKGLRDLVTAFRHVAARCPDAYLVIAGRPHESPARVHALLAEAGVEGRARTELRFLPLDRLLELLAASDVEALPHREADQSGAVLLALGMGKPVMSTRAGGIPDVVRDGVNGALVAPGDHRGLADRIVAILSDDELRARLAAGASATSAGLPSWDAIADLTLALYPGSVGAGSAAERSPAPA